MFFNDVPHLFSRNPSIIFKEEMTVLLNWWVLKLSKIKFNMWLPYINSGWLLIRPINSTHLNLEDNVFLIRAPNSAYLVIASTFVLSIVDDKDESSGRIGRIIIYFVSVLHR